MYQFAFDINKSTTKCNGLNQQKTFPLVLRVSWVALLVWASWTGALWSKTASLTCLVITGLINLRDISAGKGHFSFRVSSSSRLTQSSSYGSGYRVPKSGKNVANPNAQALFKCLPVLICIVQASHMAKPRVRVKQPKGMNPVNGMIAIYANILPQLKILWS